MLVYWIHSRINKWTGKVIINWNHINKYNWYMMFVNKKKIIRIYSFFPFSPWNTRQMHFKRIYCDKNQSPPADPLNTPPYAVVLPRVPQSNLRKIGQKFMSYDRTMQTNSNIQTISDYYFIFTLYMNIPVVLPSSQIQI